ncbi:(Fe-S)-binding protein [uncultured Sneathiella sp.]|uniref:(Fe-S)-binding protein n=1 Tax=uncultured Sneathiella sp. TaxID=879315 RepID=UPI002595AC17|nr:(Fe-S)-binding protein [uncultured Sneathiella sp.]
MSAPKEKKNVALFVTCLVDLNRPSVGFAAVKLLEAAGCTIMVPEVQTCCGQIAYNSGDKESAKEIASQVIRAFQGFDYVVAPSGSCAGMVRHHYKELFEGDDTMMVAVEELSGRTYELTSFLHDICGYRPEDVRLDTTLTYHDSCSSLREMKVRDQPRALLGAVEGLEIKEAEDREACCGFGGTFCLKYSEISESMVDTKIENLLASGADTLAAGDLGCLMNIAGRLKRRGAPMKVMHVVEILAGMGEKPGLGEGDS